MQLFKIGTYNSDQSENFGVFCWINFCWDEALCVTVCMDGEKQTKTNIIENRIFSANLINEPILPLAKILAYSKTDEKDKLLKATNVSRGDVLNTPILEDSSFVMTRSKKDN
jgi:flavin reductase (DIM6/NTAB) family NADH-FMN oxidoreductase RutF